jgi:hypothetical protein
MYSLFDFHIPLCYYNATKNETPNPNGNGAKSFAVYLEISIVVLFPFIGFSLKKHFEPRGKCGLKKP